MDHESAPAGSCAHERLLLRLRILDTDENGYLDETDFDRLAARVLDAMGEPRDPAKGQAIRDGPLLGGPARGPRRRRRRPGQP